MPKYGSGKVQWTPEIEAAIRQHYPTMGAKKLAAMLNLDADAIMNRAFALGVKFNKDFQWTEATLQIVKERYATDGPAKLAKEIGITPYAVTAKARRMGVSSTRKCPPKDFEWTEDMLMAIKERYVKEGGEPLAKEFGTTIDTVRRKASSMGLHTIAGHAIAGRERAEKSTSCDIHYFDKLTPNAAWILGFTYADGCVQNKLHGVRYTLARKDEHVLEFIKRELKSDAPIIRLDNRVNPYTGEANLSNSILCLSSMILAESVVSYGIKPRKTYNDDPLPDTIPDELMPHFIRGFFDGDGTTSIYKNRGVDTCCIGFIGSPRFITGVRDTLVRLAGMRSPPFNIRPGITVDKIYTVTWYALEDLTLFHKFIYPPGDYFSLQRKKEILDKWMEMPHRGSRRPVKWTSDEEDKMRELYTTLGPTKMGELLNRDRVTVYTKARTLGLV